MSRDILQETDWCLRTVLSKGYQRYVGSIIYNKVIIKPLFECQAKAAVKEPLNWDTKN